MSARDQILTAIRRGLNTPRHAPETIAAEAAALLDDPQSTRPTLGAPTLPEAFEAKATALGTTIDKIATLRDLPRTIARYLDRHGLPPGFALQPDPALAGLDWQGLAPHDQIAPDEGAGLGLALWGIAESGSVVVHSGPHAPVLLSFLPLHHIVVLRQSTLLPYLEDYAARLDQGEPPRNAILITGPSGTTDIEGSYVRGAHGPGFLHIVLVQDE